MKSWTYVHNCRARVRKAMAYDRGSEMATHETLAAKLKISIYFCDAHRRGSVEPTKTPTA